MPRRVIALAASLSLVSAGVAAAAAQAPVLKQAAPPPSVAAEPLFHGIVERAAALRSQTAGYEKGPLDKDFTHTAAFSKFATDVDALSALDMQGHVVLVKRGVSDDLKCILKGMSQDLPVKLKALQVASDAKSRHAALEDMFYLLRDNVQVITAPPQPAA